MNLTVDQRARLHRQGITVLIEYGSGNVKCATTNGNRIYTADDLKQISKPGCFDRFTAFMGVRHAS